MVKEFSISTSRQTEMIEITSSVVSAISSSGVKNGTALVYVPHTTAAVTINENADPSVKRDIIYELNKIIPFSDNYTHAEGNSAAHIKASIIGESITVVISGGKPLLGTWQGIFFCEFDGPRRRKFLVRIAKSEQ